MYGKWGYKRHKNSQKPFEDENPSPASISTNAVHFLNPEKGISKVIIGAKNGRYPQRWRMQEVQRMHRLHWPR
jgi:hypothetical protein